METNKYIEPTNTRKLFIETYGCQMNVADSEVVASIMQMASYSLIDNIDLIIQAGIDLKTSRHIV